MATTKKISKQSTVVKTYVSTPADKARGALMPSVNGAVVIEAFQGNLMGKDTDLSEVVDGLRKTFKEIKDGDLHNLEAMLLGQATALQSIFTSLAKRASHQEQMTHYQTFLGLALKAQAQSRATISALVDLKYPRQATFVKQANIAHGPQQVNNGTNPDQYAHTRAPAGDSQPLQNELLEDARHGSTQLDTRATATPARSHPEVEAVEAVHRAKKHRG